MATIGQKIHYCEGGPGSAIRLAYVTAVHSEECVNLEVQQADGTKVPRSSIVRSSKPSESHWGWWTEVEIKEWEQPGSLHGPLTSADFRRTAPAPAALEQETAPQSDPVVVTAGPEQTTVVPLAAETPPASDPPPAAAPAATG